MKNSTKKPLVAALGAAFVTSMAFAPAVSAEVSPFGATELETGYMVLAEGKCGGADKAAAKAKEGKCGKGKCGADKAAAKAEKAKEGKCGEGKCGEGKCGADKAAAKAEKAKEAKCGEGKCGEAK